MPCKPIQYYVMARHRKQRDAMRSVTYILEKVEIVKESDLERYPEWEGWSTVSSLLPLPQAKQKRREYTRLYLVT